MRPPASGIPTRLQQARLGTAFAVVLLLPLLGSCSGTRFGEALSNSFSSPPSSAGTGTGSTAASAPAGSAPTPGPSPSRAPATPATPPPPPSPPASPAPPAGGPAARDANPRGAAARPGTGQAGPLPGTPAAPSAALPGGPTAPYRVTIRLPLADPSAPAEVVTEALRRAGVPFEVETIERVGGGGAPAATPGNSGPAATPQVRPAPPPR